VTTWLLVVLVVGVNFVFWGSAGLLRLCDELTVGRWAARRRQRPGGAHRPRPPRRLTTDDVAILMAAHNEELVISDSLRAIAELVPVRNVHVVSDCSTDRTVELVQELGARVIQTEQNVGKAGALKTGIRHFRLAERFEAVLILDADTQLDPRYFQVVLPLLDDSRVGAVAGCAQTRWHPEELGHLGAMIVAHRQRIYTLTQRLLKYGQTWRGLSATHIIPGFASIYRSRVLEQVDIDPDGLVIEDFNMTFEVHAKRLGRIAFHPAACAYTQDPSRYLDYVRQTKRWALGLWQTLRRHRPRRGVFAVALAVLIAELLTSSLFFVLLPVALVALGVVEAAAAAGLDAAVPAAEAVQARAVLLVVALGVLLPDYTLTCLVALAERRPRYLYLGVFFVAMRMTDAAIALYTLPRAWRERSTGSWVSPTRRAIDPPERLAEAA
jgi:cellulose synthase/poly-beta-1,6-N-acetylglucosamine synthase-like glycosyltransferase